MGLNLFRAFSMQMPSLHEIMNNDADRYIKPLQILDLANPLRRGIENNLYTELYIKMHREQQVVLKMRTIDD